MKVELLRNIVDATLGHESVVTALNSMVPESEHDSVDIEVDLDNQLIAASGACSVDALSRAAADHGLHSFFDVLPKSLRLMEIPLHFPHLADALIFGASGVRWDGTRFKTPMAARNATGPDELGLILGPQAMALSGRLWIRTAPISDFGMVTTHLSAERATAEVGRLFRDAYGVRFFTFSEGILTCLTRGAPHTHPIPRFPSAKSDVWRSTNLSEIGTQDFWGMPYRSRCGAFSSEILQTAIVSPASLRHRLSGPKEPNVIDR